MNKKTILPTLIAIVLCLTSCEDKHNHLGDLNGNWQLTSWTQNDDGTLRADKTSGIYYSISIELLKIWSAGTQSKYYITTFRHTSDSLILTRAYASPFDSIVEMKDLSAYGVPLDGAFRITTLDNKHLTLTSKEACLEFRKN